MENITHSLTNNPNPELGRKADEWTDKMVTARLPDGYISTSYALTGLNKHWANMDKHEVYCAGHMIEAVMAYYKATGKRMLLNVSTHMVDYMMTPFGSDGRRWAPGHGEIELAFVKSAQTTGEFKYMDFANWLLE